MCRCNSLTPRGKGWQKKDVAHFFWMPRALLRQGGRSEQRERPAAHLEGCGGCSPCRTDLPKRQVAPAGALKPGINLPSISRNSESSISAFVCFNSRVESIAIPVTPSRPGSLCPDFRGRGLEKRRAGVHLVFPPTKEGGATVSTEGWKRRLHVEVDRLAS